MVSTKNETLAIRLAEILLRLNNGDVLDPTELASEYGVHVRTIQRDINRLGPALDRLPDGRWQLAPEYRGKLRPRDLELFARITGVEHLFPNNSQRFLLAVLDTLVHSSFLVRGHQYERLRPNDPLFGTLSDAVREHRRCRFDYADKRRLVDPYRLVNHRGIWYLAATEEGRLKAFSLGRIGNMQPTEDFFEPNDGIHRQIEDEDDIWFNVDKTEVLLKVAPQAAYYFQRRKLLPQQAIVKSMEDGGLILSSRISAVNQILPIVRYWIPSVRILEPAWLRDELQNGNLDYLEQGRHCS